LNDNNSNYQSGKARNVVQANHIFGGVNHHHYYYGVAQEVEYPYEPGYRSDAETPDPVYSDVEEYVTKRFLPMFPRVLGGEFRWCSHWWEHAEAISLLTGLWHSWEVMRLEPGIGIVAWYRDFLYPLLPMLMGPNGPFAMCSEHEHNLVDQAFNVPAPDGYWDTP